METQTILVVEDEQDILDLIAWHLKSAGYNVLCEKDGHDALKSTYNHCPDLIILDLMLPGMDGLSVCKELKKSEKTSHIPIVMVTAKGDEIDRVLGFELGADDYIVKPFSPRELILRIRAILKRQLPADTPKDKSLDSKDNSFDLMYNSLKVDINNYRAYVDDQEINLTVTEFKLLIELMRHNDQVRTRDQLLDQVWGYQFEGYARTVDTHIRRLRQKLKQYADAIETVRGVGYRFKGCA